VSVPTFVQSALPHKLVFRFNEAVAPGALAQALTLVNRTTGQTIPAAVLPVAYNALSTSATYRFVGASQGRLPDGLYRATLAASAVTDPTGHPMAENFTYDFAVLSADATGDGAVDFNDLVALAQNYNTVGNTYANGDFNFDGTVDFNDLVTLAQRYNTGALANLAGSPAVPASVPLPTASAATPPQVSVPRIGDATGAAAASGPSVRPGIASDLTFGVEATSSRTSPTRGLSRTAHRTRPSRPTARSSGSVPAATTWCSCATTRTARAT
jgi:hypothetical protein